MEVPDVWRYGYFEGRGRGWRGDVEDTGVRKYDHLMFFSRLRKEKDVVFTSGAPWVLLYWIVGTWLRWALG